MKIIPKLIAATVISTMPLISALSSATAQAGDALDRVMDRKVLKVATDANWAPQSFLNDNNEMDGFDVNVAQEIARRLGVDVEFVTPDWAVITAGNWHGRWDVSVGSMTPTTERAQVLSFPAVYYFTPASFVVHKNSEAKNYQDLNGKSVGVTTSSAYELYMNQELVIDAIGAPAFDYYVDTDKLKSYQVSNVALDDLRLGDCVRVCTVLTSLQTATEAIKNNYPIKTVGAPVFYEPLAVAIDKGDQEFTDKLKEVVQAMRSDGTLTDLSMKWYGVDYTSVQ